MSIDWLRLVSADIDHEGRGRAVPTKLAILFLLVLDTTFSQEIGGCDYSIAPGISQFEHVPAAGKAGAGSEDFQLSAQALPEQLVAQLSGHVEVLEYGPGACCIRKGRCAHHTSRHHVARNASRRPQSVALLPRDNSLSMPYGLSAEGDKLFVADTANSRILAWQSDELGLAAGAFGLLGQPDFQAKGDNRWQPAEADGFCRPYALQAGDGFLVIADSGNNRLSVWRLRS